MSTSPYRSAAITPLLYAPPVGWTRWATAVLLAAILVPVASTLAMLADLKDCDGHAVPRWDEAGVLVTASSIIMLIAAVTYPSVRRRIATIRTRRAFTSGAWSLLGLSPALLGLIACSGIALHFSLEHLFDNLCIDIRPLFWHGC